MVLRGTTIIRTLLMLDLSSTSVAGAWGQQNIDLAIGITTREAFAAGVLPDPDTNVDKPVRGWMWRYNKTISQNGVGGQVIFPIFADIRGARKIENGKVFLIATNNPVVGTAFTIDVRGLIRMLVKLP